MLCSQPSLLTFFFFCIYTIIQYLDILVQITNESAVTFHSQRKYRKGSNLVRKSFSLLNKLFSFCFFLVISFCTLKNTDVVRPRNTAQSDGHVSLGTVSISRPKQLKLRSGPWSNFFCCSSLLSSERYTRISSHIILQKIK